MLGDDGNQIGTHSALSIPHLNGSFPEFMLRWTIGAESDLQGFVPAFICAERMVCAGGVG
jgi:hypothetical protein